MRITKGELRRIIREEVNRPRDHYQRLSEAKDNMNTHTINLDDLKSARRTSRGEVSASDIGLPTDLPQTFRISGVPQSTYTATSRMNVYGTPVVRYQNAFGETLRVMGY